VELVNAFIDIVLHLDRHLQVLVASPIVMWLGLTREDLAKPEKKAQPEAVV